MAKMAERPEAATGTRIPDDIVDRAYTDALEAYWRTLAEHVAFRHVKSNAARVDLLREQRENVAAMEASFPRLKNLRRERESESSTAAPTEGLDPRLLLPDLPAKEVE